MATVFELLQKRYPLVRDFLQQSADASRIPLRLILGTAIAESKLDPLAERWGRETDGAAAAIIIGQWAELKGIINRAGSDVSFGVSQRIVRYHWAGDQTMTVENCLRVREAVFADPARDILEMGKRLRDNFVLAHSMIKEPSPVGDDAQLGAAVIYNAGHWPVDATEWAGRAAKIEHYREGFAFADELLAGVQGSPAAEEGTDAQMTIEDRAQQLQLDAEGNPVDRLGNGGKEESPVVEWTTTDGDTMRFQQYWNCGLLEYPTVDGDRGVITLLEGTLPSDVIARFQS